MVIVFLGMIEIEMAEVLLATSGLIFVLIAQIFSQIQLNIFYLLIPKVKPVSIGIFYRPPNENTFLETFFNDFKYIDLHKNEFFCLGNFNVNLQLNDKLILKESRSLDFTNLSSLLVSKSKELCPRFFLKIIQEPTRVTSN